MFPQEARLRNLTYSAPLYVDVRKRVLTASGADDPIEADWKPAFDDYGNPLGVEEEKVFIGKVSRMANKRCSTDSSRSLSWFGLTFASSTSFHPITSLSLENALTTLAVTSSSKGPKRSSLPKNEWPSITSTPFGKLPRPASPSFPPSRVRSRRLGRSARWRRGCILKLPEVLQYVKP